MLALLPLALFAQTPEGTEAGAPTERDAVQLIRGSSAWDLEWADAEDRLHGTVRPLDPFEGRPLEVSVRVGTLQGAEFDGPVTLTLRCEGWSDTRTVRRAKSERGWFVQFTPEAEGNCSLDLAFTTTRYKRLHAKIPVQPAPLSRAPWYALLAVLSAGALGLGVRAIFYRPEQA
jgi:hypothetical protein